MYVLLLNTGDFNEEVTHELEKKRRDHHQMSQNIYRIYIKYL